MKFPVTLCVFAAALPLAAQAALSSDDASYLTSAIQSQLGRYAMASLANKNGASPQVKSLAKSITAQSTAANHQLTSIAKTNGVSAPTSPSVRENYHYAALTSLHGKAFDQQFVEAFSTDDQLAVSNDQAEAKAGGDARLKAFAKTRLSVLQKELQILSKIHP